MNLTMKALTVLSLLFASAHAFSSPPLALSPRASMRDAATPAVSHYYKHTLVLQSSSENDDRSSEDTSSDEAKQSLEEKMKNWEATKDDTASNAPVRSDAFDVGLWIAFPIMVLASLAFAFFPFIMNKIDVSSVGPPPTI